MKECRRLKSWQRGLLRSEGVNPREFLYYDKDAENYYFVERKTGRRLFVRR